jgi:general secretion pathway protein I
MPVLRIDSVPDWRRKKIDVRVKRKKRVSGFTLLEVMVAISIIAIALMAVYKLYAQTLSMNESLMFNTHAPLLAQKKMAELFSAAPNDLTDNSGDFGDEFKNYSWKALVESVTSDLLGDMAEDLRRIDLIISFNSDEQSYRLRAYRFIRN